jgi:peptidoglycan/LPS O-acetylase OafA/YrhL
MLASAATPPTSNTPAPSRSWSRGWSRIAGVDILRSLAILYVLLNHINMRLLGAHVHYLQHLPPALATALVWQGQRGVQIFFVVSGFLITSTSLRRWSTLSRVSIRDFYLIRFARIAPLFLTLLAVLSLLHALGVNHYVVSPKQGGLRSALIAALTLRIGLLEAHRGYLPANWDILWSLSVEELFYLFFPLAARFLSRARLFIPLLAVLIILGPFARSPLFNHNEVWQEYSYLGGMDAIALGCLTAILLTHRTISRRTLRIFLVVGVAILLFCLCLSGQPINLHLEHLGLDMTLLALGTCLLVAVSTQSRWRAPRILTPILSLGRHSYEIYLTHMFVLLILFDRFVALGKPLVLVAPLFVVAIPCAGLFGALVAHLYSEPLNRRLRTLFGDSPQRLGSVLDPTTKPLL